MHVCAGGGAGGAEWARATFCIGKIVLCRNSVKHSIEPVYRLCVGGEVCGCFASFTPAQKGEHTAELCFQVHIQFPSKATADGTHAMRTCAEPDPSPTASSTAAPGEFAAIPPSAIVKDNKCFVARGVFYLGPRVDAFPSILGKVMQKKNLLNVAPIRAGQPDR